MMAFAVGDASVQPLQGAGAQQAGDVAPIQLAVSQDACTALLPSAQASEDGLRSVVSAFLYAQSPVTRGTAATEVTATAGRKTVETSAAVTAGAA